MPNFYHGTRWQDAQTMQGPPGGPGGIDVTRGGGEFGRGFYTQNSISNSLRWVQHRFPVNQRPCVLQLAIDDQVYTALTKLTLTARQARQLTQRLRSQGGGMTHVAGVGVIIGPLQNNVQVEQQKFESVRAQDVLNGHDTQRTVI